MSAQEFARDHQSENDPQVQETLSVPRPLLQGQTLSPEEVDQERGSCAFATRKVRQRKKQRKPNKKVSRRNILARIVESRKFLRLELELIIITSSRRENRVGCVARG